MSQFNRILGVEFYHKISQCSTTIENKPLTYTSYFILSLFLCEIPTLQQVSQQHSNLEKLQVCILQKENDGGDKYTIYYLGRRGL